MNLVNGEIIDTQASDAVLLTLQDRLTATLSHGWLDTERVIDACDRLVMSIDETTYLAAMTDLGIAPDLGRSYLAEARQMFCADSLRARMSKELGVQYGQTVTFCPPGKAVSVSERIVPLGVLLHVAAGNADGLPAFSVLEGLLTGNINILKLPAAEGGLSVRLLLELIKIDPGLAEYIYVFDYSSKDILHIRQLAAVADAIVVWGGAEAVTALRQIATPNTRLIEWGHKVSFAYVTPGGMTTRKLSGLARNIAETGQLLCSSCQGIYLDTADMADVYDFCRNFLPILEDATAEAAGQLGIGVRTQVALQLYTEELEGIYHGSTVFKGDHSSLIAYPDRELKPAIQFGHAWVKALPRQDLLAELRPYKNYLQTAGLLCDDFEQSVLERLLWQCGVVRVCPGERMSGTYVGVPHDGEYPLSRYTKVVSCETSED